MGRIVCCKEQVALVVAINLIFRQDALGNEVSDPRWIAVDVDRLQFLCSISQCLSGWVLCCIPQNHLRIDVQRIEYCNGRSIRVTRDSDISADVAKRDGIVCIHCSHDWGLQERSACTNFKLNSLVNTFVGECSNGCAGIFR